MRKENTGMTIRLKDYERLAIHEIARDRGMTAKQLIIQSLAKNAVWADYFKALKTDEDED